MNRSPSNASANGLALWLGSGAGSAFRMAHTDVAETRKDKASKKMAIGAVTAFTRTPVRRGPSNSAAEADIPSLRLLPRSSSGATRTGK